LSFFFYCRALQLDIPADSEASPSPRRNIPASVSSPLVNGDRSVFRDHNPGFTALASPVRRDVGNRHVCNPSIFCFPLLMSLHMANYEDGHNISVNLVLSFRIQTSNVVLPSFFFLAAK
jgi:hypothetical protein